MDNSYVGLDETVLRATPHTHHNSYLDALLVRPQISRDLLDTSSRIKTEDMASGISSTFSWPTASPLYGKIPFPESNLRQKSHTTPSISGNLPSFSNPFGTMDFVASTTAQKPSDQMVSSALDPMTTKGMYNREADSTPTNSTFKASSPFSTSSIQAFEVQNSFSPSTGLLDDESITASIDTHSVAPTEASPEFIANFSDSSASPGKQNSSSFLNIEDTDPDRLKSQNQNGKRRKMQKKTVIFVPIGDGKQKSEAPPSDNWAWRKYGQKPIKGSPYPRGYYRCSSSKGCSARKQVERSSTDPNMLVVTYTSDHDHPCPANRSSKMTIIAPASLPAQDEGQEEKYLDQADEQRVTVIPSNHEATTSENLFSSIINSPEALNEQVVSPLDSLHDEESCFNLQRIDTDLCSLSGTVSSTEEDHELFDDLGELPELSAIFNKGYLDESFIMQHDGYEVQYTLF